MNKKPNNDDILNKLLSIDLSETAYKLGLVDTSPEKLTYDDVCDVTRELNQLSIEASEESKNKFITISALLWEYAGDNYKGLKDVLIQLLSRIGYAPSSIIIDSEFNNYGLFSPLASFIAQLATEINHRKYEVSVGDRVELLTDFQYNISKKIRSNKIVGISAPTSAGKSFVLMMEAARVVIEQQWDIIYIVPTLSLINQVTEDFIKYFKELKIKGIKIFNTYNPEFVKDKEVHIFILTQERAIAAFSMIDSPFQKQSMLIIDEIQNIEHFDSGDSEIRSKILMDTIFEFRFLKNINKIIISGARISKMNSLCEGLFDNKDCVVSSTDVSPVLNLTYSIAKRRNYYSFKQYCSLLKNPKIINITNPSVIVGYGRKRYNDSFLQYLSTLVLKLGDNSQNIIFAPTSTQARKIAVSLCSQKSKTTTDDLHSLSEYLKETIRDNYDLAIIVENGIAYHHGKLPSHVRRVIEYAVSKKILNNIVCTTTLMQGLNMPAQNVIIRNPHLYINKNNGVAELSSYEMANLRGRAGRLLKDFVGRTFVLDENEFLEVTDEYKQETLFENTYKELNSSYGKIYKNYTKEIQNAMDNQRPVNELLKDYGFIVVHIRQAILRHGSEARKRLSNIGIQLSDNQFKEYELLLSKLSVPRAVCLKNRYWDPQILNLLFMDKLLPALPTNPSESDASELLQQLLKYLRRNENYSYFFNERIPDRYKQDNMLQIMCDLSLKWVRQQPLKNILAADYYEDADHIEETMQLLQKTIAYDLPILLKPIYDIKNIEPIFLSFLDAGAYQPIVRKLIEIGIPRESAIYLYNNLLNRISYSPDNMYEVIRSTIQENISSIPKWIAVQLLPILI
jgi:superfamily II DNA/RNA helicase